MDWADPIPNSIADRVMREIDKNGRGIVLFHDIHERTVKALPLVMSRLVAEGYQFAGWDGKSFSVQKPGETRGFVDVSPDAAAPAASAAASMAAVSDTTTEGDSWAVVIGIDDYAHWPKLSHAARDAESVQGLLVDQARLQAGARDLAAEHVGHALQHPRRVQRAAAQGRPEEDRQPVRVLRRPRRHAAPELGPRPRLHHPGGGRDRPRRRRRDPDDRAAEHLRSRWSRATSSS